MKRRESQLQKFKVEIALLALFCRHSGRSQGGFCWLSASVSMAFFARR